MSDVSVGGEEKKKKEDEDRKRREEKGARLRKAAKDELHGIECYHGNLLEEHVKCLFQKGDYLVRSLESADGSITAMFVTVNYKGMKSLPIWVKETKAGIIYYSLDKKNKASSLKELLEKSRGNPIPYEVIVPIDFAQAPDEKVFILNPIAQQAWEQREEQVELMKKLGEGAFGEVHLGKLKIRMGAQRWNILSAIKVIKRTGENEKAASELQKEGALIRNFCHQNVVKIYGMIIEIDTIMVVMQFINGRELDIHLKLNKVSMEEKVSYAIDIANGLAYIHSLNCIHRDIACGNCVIDISRKLVKIGDLESTRQTEAYKIRKYELLRVQWTAPEVFLSYEYNRAADIYAYGILVWEIFADGAIPFGTMTIKQIKVGIQGTLRPQWPSGTPIEVIETINSCWAGDAAARPQLAGMKAKLGIREKDRLRSSMGFLSRPFDVDSLLSRILNVGAPGAQSISEYDVMMCCLEVKAVFASQSSLLEMDPPLVVCGNIHGQYVDLLRIFDKEGFPPISNYLFLGDYVDRGQQNIETIILLFCYKIKYPNNFFMLRGNHECPSINRVYGFYEECNRRYKSTRLWQYFIDVFNWMPLTALIGGRILSMHGGLSPRLNSLAQLRKISRPQDPPNRSMEFDLMWSDPDLWIKGWQVNTRGASYVFGQDVVMGMCETLGIDMIVRAHQVVQDGYEFFAGRRLVTLFSVPNYCGQFENDGATMRVGDEMRCTFVTYKTVKSVRMEMQQDGVDITQEE